MSLTDTAVRNAKPKGRRYRISDGKGLYLVISPHGGKWWRLKYRFEGKDRELSLGTYPEISIKDARERCIASRTDIAKGFDPAMKRAAKGRIDAENENSFHAVAKAWIEKRGKLWAPTHTRKIARRLELDVYPVLGTRPIGDLTAGEVLRTIEIIERRGAVDTAHRAMQTCGQIFRFAVATGRAERDITVDLRGALAPVKKSHFPSITDPKAISGLLRTIDTYTGSVVTRCALRLAPLVFVRPGELRKAEWTEVDLKAATWIIPANRMKMRVDHIVPLSRQSMEILNELSHFTGKGKYLFPSARTSQRPMSDNAVLGALRRLGIAKEEMTGHGFRAMARTVLDEVLQVRPDYIEHQLAHAVRDPNGRAYNRTAHLDERKKMMQQWADYLDELRSSGDLCG